MQERGIKRKDGREGHVERKREIKSEREEWKYGWLEREGVGISMEGGMVGR